MSVRYEGRRLTPGLCRAEPDVLFVYGDNLMGWGKAGQAVIRDEPNAVGVPTKRAPRMDPGAFFTDDDWSRFKAAAAGPLGRLRAHVEAGGTIAWPAAGIGTGLAELPTRAPQIWAALERARARLDGMTPSPSPLAAEGKTE